MLVKHADALQALERVDVLIVDKTGTLTEGAPRLVDIVPAQVAYGAAVAVGPDGDVAVVWNELTASESFNIYVKYCQ